MAITTLANVKEYLGITDTSNDSLLSNLITRVQSLIETYCERTFDSTAYTSWLHGDGTNILYLPQWPVTALTRIAIGRRSAGSLIHSNSLAYSVIAQNDGTTFTVTEHLKSGTDNTASATIAAATSISALMTDLEGDVTSLSSSLASDLQDYPSAELEIFYGREMINGSLNLILPDKNIQDFRLDTNEGSLYRMTGWPAGWENVYVAYTAGYSTIPGALAQIAIEVIADVYQSSSINTTLKREKIGDYEYENAVSGLEIKTAVTKRADDLDKWKRLVYA